jgi:hypothetical protein
MIKVKLKKYHISEFELFTPKYYELLTTYKEMKQWCRDTYGKGYDDATRKWCWRSGVNSEEVENDDYNTYMMVKYVVFFFTSEEHASWFLMRWG